MAATQNNALLEIAQDLRQAAQILASAPTKQKNTAIIATAKAIKEHKSAILAANEKDMLAAQEKTLEASKLDRLALDEARLQAMCEGLEIVAALPDPVGQSIKSWQTENGLRFNQIRTPIGVLAIIYESRPNVTIDAGALCLKSGNGVLLRGGSESFYSSRALHLCLQQGLQVAGLPVAAIAITPSTDRALVGDILTGLDGLIDVIIPRGGKSLIARVQAEARIPVLGHLDGICHIYVDEHAELEKAVAISVNAKMRRPGICGAAETLLVHEKIAPTALPLIAGALADAGCSLRGCERARKIYADMEAAQEQDWSQEYLAPIISIKIVDDIKAAMAHIAQYGSGHTESIITESDTAADAFLTKVDSAIVMQNASTQFADGGEFGFGCEIGIATSRLHARGPVALEGLTTYKYQIRGTGQTRP